jgi:NADPH:quinone reductase-like Zn-dependent oxidoreductase
MGIAIASSDPALSDSLAKMLCERFGIWLTFIYIAANGWPEPNCSKLASASPPPTNVAKEIDKGRIRTTVSDVLSPINAETMREAHRLIETGKAKGKIVVEGF